MVCSANSICPDLWALFSRYKLIINMRQQQDPQFFEVLQELRVGLLSDSSRAYLEQRVLLPLITFIKLEVYIQVSAELMKFVILTS